MTEKQTWEAFFDAHTPVYEENVFTKNTVREVDFLPGRDRDHGRGTQNRRTIGRMRR